jgi:rhodanese-related sulfurtransferase
LKKGLNFRPISSSDEMNKLGIVILDTRSPKEFEAGFIPGSINLPLTMNYAIWAGTLFTPDT